MTNQEVISKEQLLADVDALKAGLQTLPASAPLAKAIYQCERLHLAIRTSHNEGTRFAAFTVNTIIRDLGAVPPPVIHLVARIRATLEAGGLDLHK